MKYGFTYYIIIYKQKQKCISKKKILLLLNIIGEALEALFLTINNKQ